MIERETKIVYLACPYTDASADVREERFRAATRAATKLIEKGLVVFSPITMTHPIDIEMAGAAGTLGSEYWGKFDEAFMSACSELAILKIEGWDTSLGVARELRFFEARGLPVWFVDP
ncbi:DUF1937 family protein [Bradyrhizobium symbiodeficiens]|uniref:DUF1937 family protein n=1 Tax=Bradyrhizobium symbiodeficiens TaxID=1404367 RepID=UPI0030D0F262